MSTSAPLAGMTATDVRPRFKGSVLMDGDPAYDEARTLFNAMIDRRPALIVRARCVDDVIAAVDLARESGADLAIKGGGHGLNGHAVCDGGLMLDLSLMTALEIDRQDRIARAQSGLTWGEFDVAAEACGLATTGGRVTSTGIAGFTLGSGSGWLERLHGYAADNLLEAEVVTAEGTVVRANEDENEDLFWGLRGGHGNFGVVTEFVYRLHPMPSPILGGMVLYPMSQARDVLRFYRDWADRAPDEFGGGVAIVTGPPPYLPPEMHDRLIIAVLMVAFTDPITGAEIIRPIREFGSPAVDGVGLTTYAGIQKLLDPGDQPGNYHYWKAELAPELTDEIIDLTLDHGQRIRSPYTVAFWQPLGGQLARPRESESAVTGRSAGWMLHALGQWEREDEGENEIAWVREWGRLIEPFAQPGVPMTLSADTGEARVRATYGDKYERLVALKRKYDPGNLFRLNHNIPP